jgi:hypothetical protein
MLMDVETTGRRFINVRNIIISKSVLVHDIVVVFCRINNDEFMFTIFFQCDCHDASCTMTSTQPSASG